jgi:hypothetical protein
MGPAFVFFVFGTADGSPVNHQSGLLTLADLPANLLPIAVCSPQPGRVATFFAGGPERNSIDAPVWPKPIDADWTEGSVFAVPWHFKLACTLFDGVDDLRRDTRVNVPVFRCGIV